MPHHFNLCQRHPNVNWQEVARLFHALWYYGPEDTPPWETMTWRGVPALKCPMDAWMYQEIIHRTRPEVILETGVRFGGSTMFLADLLELTGQGQVVSVDISLADVRPEVRAHPRVTLLEGSSTDAGIAARLAMAATAKRTMVILDSNHAAPHVLREMELYGPLVTPGCYMIVEDSNVGGHPVPGFDVGAGPMGAIEEFLRTRGGEWASDASCERLMLTFNPSGYLLKSPRPAV